MHRLSSPKEEKKIKKNTVAFLISFLVLMVGVAALAGCGEKAQEVTTTAEMQLQSSPEVSQLKTALTAMTDPATYGSTDSLQAAWSNVESAYNAVIASAQETKGVASEKISALEAAFNQLKAAVTNFGSDQPTEQKVDTLQAAVQGMKTALGQL